MGVLLLCKAVARACWRWSGCPLVVLLCVPALVMHTRHLAGSIFEPENQCGARIVWDRVASRPGPLFIGGCLMAVPPRFQITESNGEFNIKLLTGVIENRSSSPSPGIDVVKWCAWEPFSEERGLWARTYRKHWISLPSRFNQTPTTYWSRRQFERVMVKLADAYEEAFKSYPRAMYSEEMHRRLREGKAQWNEPIYAGYVHNALAIFLLSMTGRGLFNSRRWWGAMKARLRSRKNLCISCGYDLAGLGSGVCPECGGVNDDER